MGMAWAWDYPLNLRIPILFGGLHMVALQQKKHHRCMDSELANLKVQVGNYRTWNLQVGQLSLS